MPNGLPLVSPQRRLASLAQAQFEGPEAVEAEKAIRLLTTGATAAQVLPFVEESRRAGVITEAERRLAIAPEGESFIQTVLQGVAIGLAGAAVGGALGATLAPGFITAGTGSSLARSFAAPRPTGVDAMGHEFEAGLVNGGGGFFSGFGDILTGVVQEVGIPLLRQEFLPTQVGGFGAAASQVGLPAIRPAAVAVGPVAARMGGVFRVGAIALNTVVSAMRSAGVRATVAKARAFVKRFGPEAAVGFFAGFVGSEVANRAVLEAAFLKGRRMNPGNASALRRAVRRVESFHRLCKRADVIAGPRRRRPGTRRCSVCKVSPCRC